MSELEYPPQEHRPQFNRETARQQLETLLASKVSFDEIVDLLGAQQYVKIEQQRSKSPLRRFDVERFLNEVPVNLPGHVEHVPMIILPPDEGRLQPADPTNLEPERFERSSVPRTRYLVELLADLGIPYRVYSGEVSPAMIRSESYRVFLLPEQRVLIFVNNEAKNATYVVRDIQNVEQVWEEFAERTKQELRADERSRMIAYHNDPERWKIDVAAAIEENERPPRRPLLTSQQLHELETAPERPEHGWLTLRELAEALGYKNLDSVHGLLKEYEDAIQEEWIQPFRDRINKVRPHYAQELADYLKATLLERAPEGWLPFYKIEETGIMGRETLRSELDIFKQEFPKKSGRYGVRGKEGSYFSPEVLEWLRKRERVPVAPEGWWNIHQLAGELDVTDLRVARRVGVIRESHPEWVNPYLDTHGRLYDHVAPELVAVLRDEFTEHKQIEQAPGGWMTATELAALLEIDFKQLKTILPGYKASRPNDFQRYRNALNTAFEYLSPELIQLIKDEHASVPKVPDSWVTHRSLADELVTRPTVIRNIAERYRTEHPEWFGNFRRGLNVREYYAPELQERIRQDYVPKRRKKLA